MNSRHVLRIVVAVALCVVAAVFVILGALSASLQLPEARAAAPAVIAAAAEYDLNPYVVLAVVAAESAFDAHAVSAAGAVGLMQLMPETARWLCAVNGWEYRPDMLTDADFSLRLGCCYLAYLGAHFDGDWVLAAYNAGEGVTIRWIEAGLRVEEIPYAETRRYVVKVRKLAKAYRVRRICG